MSRYLAAFVFAVSASGAIAQSEGDDPGEKLVRDFLTDVTTLEADFEQSLIDADDTIIDHSSGTLELERPARFRWSYSEPYEQWLVADGVNIWSYDVDLEQVTVKRQAEALANTPALLLGGSEAALQQFDFAGTTMEQVTTWVRLVPKDKSSGFNRVELGFIDAELQRMIFYDSLQQTTLIQLNHVTVNEPIEDARFRFAVPEGVDLVGKPATIEAANH